MSYHLFQYPIPGPADLADLNACLASHRVVAVQQHLVPHPGGATLVFVVHTTETSLKTGPGRKIDWKEVLTPEDFTLYSRLRDQRKSLADAEGVPVYSVFSNDLLAEIARRRPASLADLSQIEGFGQARLQKYGPSLIALIHPRATSPHPETPSTP
jgi:superfamily II DNA helicase RecQ